MTCRQFDQIATLSAKTGKQEFEEDSGTNIDSGSLNTWIDVRYIVVPAGTYFVQYSQIGPENKFFSIAIIANNKVYARESSTDNSYYNSCSISTIVKMTAAGIITPKIYSAGQLSNAERHIGCYRIA